MPLVSNPASRTRLYLASAGAMAVLLVMAGVTWYSNRVSGAALDRVVEQSVRPLLALQAIDRQVKEVRFRIAGVVLDQMPAPGSRQHLAEARAAIPRAWAEYQAATAAATADEREVVRRLDTGLAALARLFDKIDRAYAAADDKDELLAILEDDWPAVTTNVMKPIDRLITLLDGHMAATYADSRSLGQRLTAAAIAMGFLAALLALHILRQPGVLRREVDRRTRELRELNRQLKAEVAERLAVERALREGEALLERRVAERTADLTRMNRQLEETHQQLLQSEKMASIGQLAAGVAHEINNPIGFVNSNLGTLGRYLETLLELAARYEQAAALLPPESPLAGALAAARRDADLDYLREDAASLLRESMDGIARVRGIVQDLKDFSHVDNQDWQEVDLHHGLESTLNVAWNELKHKADVVRDYGSLPPVRCLAGQINQVFLNLFVNAAQAMEGRGTITVRTGADARQVWVEIADTGRGIAPEHLSRIFEPFFTTKPVGKGTGLGLSLSYGIVRKHGGSIEVASQVGQGSSFRISLPRQSQPAACCEPAAPAQPAAPQVWPAMLAGAASPS